MEPSFWRARWSEGRIGFHLSEPNPLLVAHAGSLPPRSRVLVPLCGKSVDLGWLAGRGHAVVGVELVPAAARAFFEEAGAPFSRTQDGPFERYEGESVEILAGDLFETTAGQLGTFDAVYDRAALIALPPPLRARYASHLRPLLAPGGTWLLVSLDGDFEGGPPFAVPDDEVRRLFDGFAIEVVEEVDALVSAPHLAARGATRVVERVYRMRA